MKKSEFVKTVLCAVLAGGYLSFPHIMVPGHNHAQNHQELALEDLTPPVPLPLPMPYPQPTVPQPPPKFEELRASAVQSGIMLADNNTTPTTPPPPPPPPPAVMAVRG